MGLVSSFLAFSGPSGPSCQGLLGEDHRKGSGRLPDHVVGVGNRAAGGEPAERAVDQRWKMAPGVLKVGETLETTLRRDGVRRPGTEEEMRMVGGVRQLDG